MLPTGTAPRSVHLGGGMAVPSQLATRHAMVRVSTWSMVAEICTSATTLRAALRRNGCCYRGSV
jgi:hypothetical protein